MIVEYANYLSSQGHDVVIAANSVNTVFKLQARIEQTSKFRYKINTIFNAVFLKKYCDVIIADIIAMVAFLSIRHRGRILYFAQDYDEAYYKNGFLKLLIRSIYYYCLSILKIPVIAVSDELGQLLRKRFNANVTVVKNGVDRDVFFPEKDDEYISLKDDSKVILVFARHDYRKGFDIAINVLSEFRNAIEKRELMVWAVGARIEVPFHMKNFGFVAPEQLRKILSCSDVLLYPSRHEGLPLLVLEALSCGCPVVTTEAVHFLKNKNNALICKIEDELCLKNSLVSILVDSNLRTGLSKAGLDLARAYSLSESKKEFHKAVSLAGHQ